MDETESRMQLQRFVTWSRRHQCLEMVEEWLVWDAGCRVWTSAARDTMDGYSQDELAELAADHPTTEEERDDVLRRVGDVLLGMVSVAEGER